MNESFLTKLLKAHGNCPACPSPGAVADFFTTLIAILFPEHASRPCPDLLCLEQQIDALKKSLKNMLSFSGATTKTDPALVVGAFFQSLPLLHEKLEEDTAAMFEGDPAAKSRSEVIRTYPGFYAIAAYRVANALHALNVKEIPRMITEHAHSKTGIDIHPGAKIGRSFCIDHGTGIVVGETAVIGDHVKLYQGVTLGALSVSKEDAERKRHPTIEDHVIVYAGATILGGGTTIGAHSIIGGNVWLTRSVEPHSKVYYQSTMHHARSGETDLVIVKTGDKKSIA